MQVQHSIMPRPYSNDPCWLVITPYELFFSVLVSTIDFDNLFWNSCIHSNTENQLFKLSCCCMSFFSWHFILYNFSFGYCPPSSSISNVIIWYKQRFIFALRSFILDLRVKLSSACQQFLSCMTIYVAVDLLHYFALVLFWLLIVNLFIVKTKIWNWQTVKLKKYDSSHLRKKNDYLF